MAFTNGKKKYSAGEDYVIWANALNVPRREAVF